MKIAQALQPQGAGVPAQPGGGVPLPARRGRSRARRGRRPLGRRRRRRARSRDLRAELRRHPCHTCPTASSTPGAAERALRLERENARLEAADAHPDQHHRQPLRQDLPGAGVARLPDRRGRQPGQPTQGRMLARIYAELDLVAAECIRAGVFDGLTPPQLAAVLASLGLRGAAQRRRRAPAADARRPVTEAMTAGAPDLAGGVAGRARRPAAAAGPEPDIGFSEVAYGWAAGPVAVRGARATPN